MLWVLQLLSLPCPWVFVRNQTSSWFMSQAGSPCRCTLGLARCAACAVQHCADISQLDGGFSMLRRCAMLLCLPANTQTHCLGQLATHLMLDQLVACPPLQQHLLRASTAGPAHEFQLPPHIRLRALLQYNSNASLTVGIQLTN